MKYTDMKWFSIAVLVMVVFTFGPVKSAQAGGFSFSIGFHDELSPYGSWVNYSNYGNCWRPNAYSGYRPYTDGNWNYSSYGPTWSGNEQWAPYTYNYGDWIYTARYGWIWIPGNDWHANQVQWSYGGGYIGWRPQFPAGYNSYDGYGYNGYGNDLNLWVVINADHFGYRNYRPYTLGYSGVRDLFTRQVFRTRYDRLGRTELERAIHRPVRSISLRERDVQIGNRRTRMLMTPDQEVRIQKHVQQIRGTVDRRSDDRRSHENDNVMRQKFDDIRSKSSNDFRREQDHRDYSREFSTRKFDSRKFEKSGSHDSRQSYSPREVETKKHYEPPSNRSNFSRFDTHSDSVKHNEKESHSTKKFTVKKQKPGKP